MAVLITFPSNSSSPNPNFISSHPKLTKTTTIKVKKAQISCIKASNSSNYEITPEKSTKLITFLGKGGSGKTSAAVFAAQHYAKSGLSTCLVTHSQDLAAEYLLDCKIGTVPAVHSNNLSAVRVETTKMLLDPLKRLKEADARANLSQGVFDGIVGEELGVLPGMDPILSALALEKYVGLLGLKTRGNQLKEKFDVVVYDGISTEDTLRMMSAASNARLYVKHLRSIAEKTDFGRLAAPSILRLVDEEMSLSNSSSSLNGRLSSDIWVALERILERGASAFADPRKFGCYLVTDPSNPVSVNTALRYWGCAIQAGSNISGAFGITSNQSSEELVDRAKKCFSPLPFALLPSLWENSSLDWDMILLESNTRNSRNLFHLPTEDVDSVTSPVKFDSNKRCITLFMPGFDKSEIKLYQYRGGSELLVEAGDQRRVIVLPCEVQGKVGGAKFMDRTLVITMR